MTPDRLSTLVACLHAGRCAMDRQLLQVVLAYDAQGSWRREVDGATSMADWVAAFLGVTHETATRMVRVARKLQCLPRLGKAYSEGALSWDKVRFLCRVATPETEAGGSRLKSRTTGTIQRKAAIIWPVASERGSPRRRRRAHTAAAA